jgi:hypothetical protein
VELAPNGHTRPQLPQLFGSIAESVSQPLLGFMSQSKYGSSHWIWHFHPLPAAMHVEVALGTAIEQSSPHALQLVSVPSSVAQEFGASPGHCAVPFLQVQIPMMHVSFVVHLVPH